MQANLSFSSTKGDFDKELEWFEVHLKKLLNNYAKVIQISLYSKRW